MNLPHNIKYILSIFDGYTTFIHGRAVRELLIGTTPKKCRIVTSAPVQVLSRMFPGASPSKGRIRVNVEDTELTILSAPPDPGYICSMQDFTVDAAAYSPVTGLFDRYGTQSDIDNRIIRLTDNTEECLRANPLLMVKAIRLCAELSFTLDPTTAELIKRCADTIKRVHTRTVTYELEKLLMSPHPDYFRILHQLGLLRYIIPQLERCFGEPQRNKYHIYDVGEHIMNAVKNTPRDYILRWSALLHDVGKPCCSSTDNNGVIHFYGHHRESRIIADDILHRLGVAHDSIREILTLIENHDVRVEPTAYAVKKMMCRTGGALFEKLMQLQTADNMAKNPKYFTEKYKRINTALKISKQISASNEPYQYSQLMVNSIDLQKHGAKPGRETNEIMRTLMDEVISDPSRNSRKYLLKRATELMRK